MNEAESKFFESKGQDVAASLTEEAPDLERPVEGETRPDTDWTPASAGVTNSEDAKLKSEKVSEGKFVPLQALQEERAEKKQLRKELRQYREWQAQLAQRLQQMPVVQPIPVAEAPDPQTRPLDYINHVLGNMQSTTAELQPWRQQQEQSAQQRAAVQQYESWATAQEQEFVKEQPEYPEAYRFAAEARDRELQTLGYSDPAARANIVLMNTAEIINNAIQQGQNPAELVWEYARARGFVSKAARASAGNAEAQAKIAAGLQAAGAKPNQGGATGDGEMTTKDLSGISDPEEFEKAWKRVFGKKR